MSKCGDCQACCEVLKIDNLKDRNIKCKHQCKTGCGIYKSRPKACSHFECVWLTSGWPLKYRPDKSGIMLAAYSDKIIAHRLSDEVDINLFDLVSKFKKTEGRDSRVIRSLGGADVSY